MENRIVKRLDLEMSTLPYLLLIMAAMGDSEYTTLGIKILEFEIQGEAYVCDFIVYGLRGYDIILGIDRLNHNKAFLNCKKKEFYKVHVIVK